MRKQFLLNIFFLILLNVLIKPFWVLGIDRTIQNEVGSAEYGWYFSLFGFSFLFNSLLDLGVTNFSSWSISRNPSFVRLGFEKLARLKLVLGVLYVVVTVLVALIFEYDQKSILLLFGLCINQFLLSYILFQRSVLAGLQIFWLDSIFSIMDKLLVIVGCSYLLWFSGISIFEIEWLVYVQLLSYIGTGVILLLINFMKKKSQMDSPGAKLAFAELLQKSYPFAVIILFMTFYYRIDAFMIERMLEDGATQAGYYAQSFRLFDVLNNFIFLITGILFPMLTKSFFENKDTSMLTSMVLRLLLFPAVILLPLTILKGGELMKLLYSAPFISSNQLLVLFCIALIGLGLTSVYGTALTAKGELMKMIKITGVGFGINLTLNGLLIPYYGIIAAAATSAFTQVFIGLLMYRTVIRLKIGLNQINWMFKYLAVFALLTISAFGIKSFQLSNYFLLLFLPMFILSGLYLLRSEVTSLKKIRFN